MIHQLTWYGIWVFELGTCFAADRSIPGTVELVGLAPGCLVPVLTTGSCSFHLGTRTATIDSVILVVAILRFRVLLAVWRIVISEFTTLNDNIDNRSYDRPCLMPHQYRLVNWGNFEKKLSNQIANNAIFEWSFIIRYIKYFCYHSRKTVSNAWDKSIESVRTFSLGGIL